MTQFASVTVRRVSLLDQLQIMVKVADVVKALAHVVHISAAWVRVPRVAALEMDVGKPPCTEGAPMILKDKLMIAELRMYKNRKSL